MVKKINKEKFYFEIKKLVNKGYSYIDSICFLVENFELKYKDVIKVLDDEIKNEIKKEAIDKKLIKGKNNKNIMEEIFK
jgi:hypothetical protein